MPRPHTGRLRRIKMMQIGKGRFSLLPPPRAWNELQTVLKPLRLTAADNDDDMETLTNTVNGHETLTVTIQGFFMYIHCTVRCRSAPLRSALEVL